MGAKIEGGQRTGSSGVATALNKAGVRTSSSKVDIEGGKKKMDALKNLPGSVVEEDPNPARSSYHDPDVQKAVEAYDPYRSDKTFKRDATNPKRSKGSPA